MSPQQQTKPKPPEAIKEEPKAVEKAAQQPAAPKPEKRSEKVLAGVLGVNLKPVERSVPADEPPPLPENSKLKHVGKRTPRYDGRLKVTGAARYPSDIKLPGMLYAVFVNSSIPHGRVTSIDVSAAEKHPEVRAVHILEKMLGAAELQDPSKELESRYPIIRFAGQPIAAIAATSQQAAEDAARLVKVQYDPLPFVIDQRAAAKQEAPLVFPGAAAQGETAGGGGGGEAVPQKGNVRGPMLGPGKGGKGDIEKGFAASEVTVEGEFSTQVQTHSALETHGVVADWKADGLTVYASTQGTLSVRDELAEVFELPKSKVRVVTEFLGGGFGAKFGAGNYGVVAAHLSRKAKSPVRLFMDRKEEHWSTGNRPDSWQQLKVGAAKDGKLQAIHLLSYGTAGVGTGAGVAGPAQNMYDCANVRTEEHDVFTNAGPGAAFRAPGHPQGCFALEQAMDELAEKLKLDPLALRDANDVSEARRAERRIGAERFEWSRRRPPASDAGPIKRGMGVAQSVWYRINNMDSGAIVRITRDGSVEVLSAVQDIGGGIKTVVAQVVAEELGLEPRQITVRIGDTNTPPGPPSGGSMTTGSITPPVRNAAYKAKLQLMEEVAPRLKAKAEDLVMEGGKIFVRGNPGESLTFRQAASRISTEEISAQAKRSPEYGERARIFLGGVQFCELAVDTETGRIYVERFLAVHDCGRPMNILQLESQVNGGIIQGISYALYENRVLDRNTGVMVNPNLEQYKIAGSQETPKIEVHFIEEYLGRSSTDAGGIGEPATVPTAAAMANAFYNATGVRMRALPMTPARVLAALGKLNKGGA